MVNRPSRMIRLYEKKRGGRRTGSRLIRGVGEALFFGGLFLVGCISLAVLLTSNAAIDQALDDTVMRPSTGWSFYLVLLVLGSFVGIGGGGLVYTVLHLRTSAERRASLAQKTRKIDLSGQKPDTKIKHYPQIPGDANLTNSPGVKLAYRLPIQISPGWRLLASTIFCLSWNATVSVLGVITIRGILRDQPDWWLIGLMIPFVAVSVGSIYYFFRQMLLTTGIGPTTLEISDHPLFPGKRYEIFLSQAGRLSVRWLEVNLICEEEATYRQGTDVRRELTQVFQQPVFHRVGFDIKPGIPFEDGCELEIPSDVMHSFQSEHNAVRWRLALRGDVVGWPSFERNFPIIVFPPRSEPGDQN